MWAEGSFSAQQTNPLFSAALPLHSALALPPRSRFPAKPRGFVTASEPSEIRLRSGTCGVDP